MEIKELKAIQDELDMSYSEYVAYLLNKYGQAKYDYFYNEHCVTKNEEVERLDEGLFCHHIAEEHKLLNLSKPIAAKEHPFKYQNADHLVYCNYLEHLLLHIKIALDDARKNEREGTGIDVGGAAKIWRELNTYYKTGKITVKKQKAASIIKDRREDYITIMKYMCRALHSYNMYKYCTNMDLAQDVNGAFIYEIYNEICEEE